MHVARNVTIPLMLQDQALNLRCAEEPEWNPYFHEYSFPIELCFLYLECVISWQMVYCMSNL